MLLELRVKALGIIEEINWSLIKGLNVITGETGAGKSLVIDAVEALLTGKVGAEVIRHGAKEALIEGVFVLPQNKSISPLRKLLAQKGLKTDEETLVINCALRSQGHSVVRVNGHAVPKDLLHEIGRLLIDIHGQSEHLSLLNKRKHLDFLDSYARTMDLRHSFHAKVTELHKVEQELKTSLEKEKELARREEFLHFQLDEVKRAELREGEEEELERERTILSSSEKLKALSYEAYQALDREDASGLSAPALAKLNEAVQTMRKMVEVDSALKQQLALLEETLYRLEEIARYIHSYGDGLEYDPKRLEEIESRLEIIRNLKRKYGPTTTEVLDFMGKAKGELEELSHSSERCAQLETMRSRLKEEMGQIAFELSRTRSQAARKLVNEVKKELQDLNMPQVEFDVSITQEQNLEGIPFPDGDSYAFNNEGVDNAEFIASTNPGEPPKPLAKIASTGESSRFMLALKAALAQADNIPVLIFDEIDMGVGGRSGEILGKKLWSLARNHQVICVTHLPQIAAFADAHYSVHKEVSGTRTLSMIEPLQDESRLKELSIMIAGPQYTKLALDNARELTQKADTWKKAHLKGKTDR